MITTHQAATHKPLLLLLALLIGFAPLMTLPVTTQAVDTRTFGDVADDAWYSDYLDFSANEGLFEGDASGAFNPDQELTRAEAATVLLRAQEGEDAGTGTPLTDEDIPFTDLTTDHWAAEALVAAYRSGLLQGYPDGRAAADEAVSRSELAALIARAFDMLPETAQTADTIDTAYNDTSFTDISADHWSADYVAALTAEGILQGYGDGTFRGDAPINRAETSAVFNRSLDPFTRIRTEDPEAANLTLEDNQLSIDLSRLRSSLSEAIEEALNDGENLFTILARLNIPVTFEGGETPLDLEEIAPELEAVEVGSDGTLNIRVDLTNHPLSEQEDLVLNIGGSEAERTAPAPTPSPSPPPALNTDDFNGNYRQQSDHLLLMVDFGEAMTLDGSEGILTEENYTFREDADTDAMSLSDLADEVTLTERNNNEQVAILLDQPSAMVTDEALLELGSLANEAGRSTRSGVVTTLDLSEAAEEPITLAEGSVVEANDRTILTFMSPEALLQKDPDDLSLTLSGTGETINGIAMTQADNGQVTIELDSELPVDLNGVSVSLSGANTYDHELNPLTFTDEAVEDEVPPSITDVSYTDDLLGLTVRFTKPIDSTRITTGTFDVAGHTVDAIETGNDQVTEVTIVTEDMIQDGTQPDITIVEKDALVAANDVHYDGPSTVTPLDPLDLNVQLEDFTRTGMQWTMGPTGDAANWFSDLASTKDFFIYHEIPFELTHDDRIDFSYDSADPVSVVFDENLNDIGLPKGTDITLELAGDIITVTTDFLTGENVQADYRTVHDQALLFLDFGQSMATIAGDDMFDDIARYELIQANGDETPISDWTPELTVENDNQSVTISFSNPDNACLTKDAVIRMHDLVTADGDRSEPGEPVDISLKEKANDPLTIKGDVTAQDPNTLTFNLNRAIKGVDASELQVTDTETGETVTFSEGDVSTAGETLTLTKQGEPFASPYNMTLEITGGAIYDEKLNTIVESSKPLNVENAPTLNNLSTSEDNFFDVTLTFSEDVDQETIDTNRIELEAEGEELTVSEYRVSGAEVTLTVTDILPANNTLKATVEADAVRTDSTGFAIEKGTEEGATPDLAVSDIFDFEKDSFRVDLDQNLFAGQGGNAQFEDTEAVVSFFDRSGLVISLTRQDGTVIVDAAEWIQDVDESSNDETSFIFSTENLNSLEATGSAEKLTLTVGSETATFITEDTTGLDVHDVFIEGQPVLTFPGSDNLEDLEDDRIVYLPKGADLNDLTFTFGDDSLQAQVTHNERNGTDRDGTLTYDVHTDQGSIMATGTTIAYTQADADPFIPEYEDTGNCNSGNFCGTIVSEITIPIVTDDLHYSDLMKSDQTNVIDDDLSEIDWHSFDGAKERLSIQTVMFDVEVVDGGIQVKLDEENDNNRSVGDVNSEVFFIKHKHSDVYIRIRLFPKTNDYTFSPNEVFVETKNYLND